jgi:hypothetical protein
MLATTGSGKSYGAGDFLEEYHKENFPYVMLDVAGAHWGVAEKYRVFLLGGTKGQDIEPDEGMELAVKIVKESLNQVIIDMSLWNDDEIQTFTAQFLKELRAQHKVHRMPRHVFIEEAEVVCPQVNFDKSKDSLKECNAIMKRGRSVGLGVTLISQRPQDVNKRALSQCLASFILHLELAKDLDVIREMLKNESKEKRQDLIKYVEKAQKGDCLLYSPQWLGEPQKFRFRLKETFHAGYTPEIGQEIKEPEKLLLSTVHMGEATAQAVTTEPSVEKEKISDKKILSLAIIFGTILFALTQI